MRKTIITKGQVWQSKDKIDREIKTLEIMLVSINHIGKYLVKLGDNVYKCSEKTILKEFRLVQSHG